MNLLGALAAGVFVFVAIGIATGRAPNVDFKRSAPQPEAR